jgi:hypothetical protein
MRKLDGVRPVFENTEHSGSGDLFFSQWMGWIFAEYSKATKRPTYCEWATMSDGPGFQTHLFLIDYEQRAFTPLVPKDDALWLDEEKIIRYADLFKKP